MLTLASEIINVLFTALQVEGEKMFLHSDSVYATPPNYDTTLIVSISFGGGASEEALNEGV